MPQFIDFRPRIFRMGWGGEAIDAIDTIDTIDTIDAIEAIEAIEAMEAMEGCFFGGVGLFGGEVEEEVAGGEA